MIYSIILGGLVYLTINLLKIIFRIINVRKEPLKHKYGSNTYCLIFGGSEGIGLSLAKEYAKENFNLILISRNLEKLKKAKNSLEIYNVKILTYKLDILDIKTKNVEEIMKNLDIFLEDLDISIMVYNVGIRKDKRFLEESFEKIYEMFSVNCNGNSVMNKYFIERFNSKRINKKSSIVNVSSCSTILPLSSYHMYGATKSFQELLSETLKYENYNNIDFVSFKPAFVKTRNDKSESALKEFFNIQPDECARDLVKYMTKNSIIIGSWKHEILVMIAELLPVNLSNKIQSLFTIN